MIISIHPETPQQRKVIQASEIVRLGGIVAYPTDTLFGVGCDVRNGKGIERICRLLGKDKLLSFSILCLDFAMADQYARISQTAFRIMKHVLPGPYAFILPTTSLVPKRISERRKTIGIRIPDHAVCRALIAELGAPLANISINPSEDAWVGDAYSVEDLHGHGLDAVIDAGTCDTAPSSVIDLTGDEPRVVREGKGGLSIFKTHALAGG